MIPDTTARSLLDLFSLKGRTVLVTGGAKGIGRGIALRVAEAGANVVVVDVDEPAAMETLGGVAAKGARGKYVGADLANVADVRQAVNDAVSAFGRLDVVVNNAGIFPMKPALELDEALWDRVIDVNLKGTFFLSQAAAHAMKRGGSIVNIASIDAFHPSGNLAHYDASKGALTMLTKSLALEWSKLNVRVNAVAPGGIKTPGADAVMKGASDAALAAFAQRVPLGRMGAPDDIALATLFLASDASSYVTGHTLIVDGGVLLV